MTITIDNGARIKFQDTFMQLAQQERSKLESSPAVKHIDPSGKITNIARLHGLDLVEDNTRNPLKHFVDYTLDNRQFSKRRFTVSVLLDRKQDIDELIADPTSSLMQELLKAKGRVVDRVICEAAAGDVWIGRPDRAPTILTAEEDGVLTVDAKQGLTAAKISQLIENSINNDIDMSDIARTTLLLTGSENTALMQEDKFINNNYISGHPIESGIQKNVSGYNIVLFAGSATGIGTKNNPILEENAGTRTCLALAPESVLLMMNLDRFDVTESDRHVNSKVLTVDLWIGAMRPEGVRVQKILTTI